MIAAMIDSVRKVFKRYKLIFVVQLFVSNVNSVVLLLYCNWYKLCKL